MLDRAAWIRERIGALTRFCCGLLGGRRGAAAEQVEAELEPALGLGLRAVVARRRDARRRQPVNERPELELAEALGDGAAVVSAGARLLEAELDREVDDDAADLARHERRLAVLGEPIAQLALHLVEAVVESVEGLELLEEELAVFSPTPGTPGMLSDVSPFSAL